MILFRNATALILTLAPAYCQTAPRLAFEVASVKPAAPPSATPYEEGFRAGRASQGMIIQNNRVSITDNSLKDLVRIAYRMKPYQVTGEKWMETEKYTIAATLPQGATAADAPEMLRNLLAERFHLVVRNESKELAIYALVVVKGGTKLKVAGAAAPAEPPTDKQKAQFEQGAKVGMVSGGTGVLHVRGKEYTLQAFADRLTGLVDRPVLDQTGIEGKFDIDLAFARDDASDQAPGLFTALRDQLGLRLEERKSPTAAIVIERADKVPVEN